MACLEVFAFEFVCDCEHVVALLAGGCCRCPWDVVKGHRGHFQVMLPLAWKLLLLGPRVVRRVRLRMACCHGVVSGVCGGGGGGGRKSSTSRSSLSLAAGVAVGCLLVNTVCCCCCVVVALLVQTVC